MRVRTRSPCAEFADKAYEGREREGDARPCIGCLRCLDGIMFGKVVACTMNPCFELENEDNRKENRKNVLVIGSGPAGYETVASCGAKPVVLSRFTGFRQWMTVDDILAGCLPGIQGSHYRRRFCWL